MTLEEASKSASFFSREELLEAMPGRQASTLLFAIENRTAQLVERGHRAAALYLSYAGTAPREQDFFAALARARTNTSPVTIQDMECYAPHWRSLLPEKLDAPLNAAIAHLQSKKYRFTFGTTPNLRAALALENPEVAEAYEQLFKQPIGSIYVQKVGWGERLRWAWARLAARLESMPPFWLAFFLTLPGAAGLLALPVALAKVGLVFGLVLLIGFGIINALTAAALGEASARSGTTRFGLGWLGQLVEEYLGRAGSLLLTAVLAANSFLVLIVFYLGVASTLESATSIPEMVWVAAVFGIGVYFLSRGALNSTVATALVIVFVCLVLLLLIPLLALPYFDAANLSSATGVSVLEAATVELVLGVLLSTYFSHFLVATYAPVVLRRDPKAGSWIRGCASSILVYTVIACLWFVVINGTLPSEILATTTGTVVTPLAELVGPSMLWLGSLLVILSLGLASIQVALGLYYLVRERLPGGDLRNRGSATGSGLANPRVRFVVSIVPVVGAFLLAEWLAFTGEGSFAGLLGIVCAFALPLIAGVFPVLLLAATRRKGDFAPGVVYRFLGNPIVLGALYLFFVGSIFLYGLFIFQDAITQVLLVGMGLVVVGVTIVMFRRGMLTPRVVIELRDDQRRGAHPLFGITAHGEAQSAKVELDYGNRAQELTGATGEIAFFPQLHAARFRLPEQAGRELKVWAHRLLPEGGSQGLMARLEVADGARARELELNAAQGQAQLPIDGTAIHARIVFADGAGEQ